MKYVLLITLTLLSVSGHCVSQAAQPKKVAIEKMFNLTDTDNLIDRLYTRLEREFTDSIVKMDVPPGKRPELEKQFKRYSAILREQVDRDGLKASMIEVFAKTFSQQEIDQLIEFYETPVGQKLIHKMPEINAMTMEMIEQQMQALIPKMKALQHEMTLEFAQLD